tara:strand:+ start:2760 stop:3284 length:525 start_codon:yes stop_codon:yes gene_type:complete
MEESTENIDIVIERKNDIDLSRKEIKEIIFVYNECFCFNQMNNKAVKMAKNLLAKNNVWEWYLAKLNNKVIGMLSYARNPNKIKKIKEYDLRIEKGENICSVSVIKKFRKLGIARLLMEQIIDDRGKTTNLVVEIKRSNPIYYNLAKFYESLGFIETDLDNEGEDNLFLRRNAQ